MKNFYGLFTFIGTTGINAQTQSITVHSQTTGKEEIIDVPESMQSEMDSLYWDWQSKITSHWERTAQWPLPTLL